MGVSIRVFEQVGVPHLQEKAGAGRLYPRAGKAVFTRLLAYTDDAGLEVAEDCTKGRSLDHQCCAQRAMDDWCRHYALQRALHVAWRNQRGSHRQRSGAYPLLQRT